MGASFAEALGATGTVPYFTRAAELLTAWLAADMSHLGVEVAPLGAPTTRGCAAWWSRARCTRRSAWAENTLAARAAEIRGPGVSAHGVVRSGVAVDEILSMAADERCDLIVIGTHGRNGLSRFFLGSVADRIVRLAPCPVMTVRGDGRDVGPRPGASAA